MTAAYKTVAEQYELDCKFVELFVPSFQLYQDVFVKQKGLSILRSMQYATLSSLSFKGSLIDFGGGERSSYRGMLKCDKYSSANIDISIQPTYRIGVGEALPVPDETFDSGVSMNTFEHVYDPVFAIREIARVLKPGAEFTTMVPFLFPVHAHPDDFFRPTPSWWLKTLGDCGFTDVEIIPHYWGPFSTGIVCSGVPGPFKKIRTHFALIMDVLYQKIMRPSISQKINHAVGYSVKAKKA